MHSYQREAGKVMVEEDVVAPSFFVVAGVALIALLALVHIILFMAGNSVSFHLVFFHFALVAV